MANKDDRRIAHVPSGIAGLDAVLQGGFLQGGLYIIQGTPGVGKTILGNQICFDHVAKNARALYVTLLAENHARMLLHMRQLGFFDDKRIPKSLSYISGFRALEEEGLKGLLTLVRREIQAHDASVLVIDGLVAAHESAPSDYEFKKFIHELQTLAGALGCTMFLLTSAQGQFISPEHTMVDGLISLTDELHGGQAIRHLEVQKFRGSGYLRGRHAFRITSAGITVFPRIESIYNQPKHDHPNGTKRVSSGVKKLDTMLGGGFPAATTTMVVGPSGGGKTTLGLHFLSSASQQAPSLLFGFYETPPRLLLKAKSVGIDLEPAMKRGDLEIIWQPPTENVLDELGHALLDAVARRKVKSLVIDGLQGFFQTATANDRISHFLSALTNELRTRGVTTLCTMELRDLVGPEIHLPITGVSALVENMILLRLVEYQATLLRLLSVMKVRDSQFDARLHEFVIDGTGMDLIDTFDGAEGVLTGTPHIAEPRSAATQKKKSKPRGSKGVRKRPR